MDSTRLVSEITADGKKVGDYILTKKLGEGKFGKVYVARHLQTSKIFAAKQIDQKKVTSHIIHARLLQTEINIMHEIRHPNILQLHDFMKTDNNFYLIVDFCSQGDYSQYLKNRKEPRLSEKEAVCFLKQIANGFQELRKKKILHRDFKLDNLFFHGDRLVIGDFGFAKSGVEVTTTILGTPLTMAYELLTAGKSGVVYSSKADLWSIGVVFYEMLFGKPPFSGKNVSALIEDIEKNVGDKLRFPRETSEEARHLLRQILRKDPNERMSWFEFFNHPLFDLFDAEEEFTFHNISCVDNSKKFNMNGSNHEFRQNKLTVAKNSQNFMDSDDLLKKYSKINLSKHDVTVEIKIKKSLKDDFEEKLLLKEVDSKYNHELNKIDFIFFTVRNLQNHIKTGFFKPLTAEMFELSILIVHIGLKYIQERVNRLEKNQNEFGFASQLFYNFVKGSKHKKILGQLFKIRDKFEFYLDKLTSRIKREKLKFDLKGMKDMHIREAETQLTLLFNNVKGYMGAKELSEKKKLEAFLRMLMCLKYTINHESMLKFSDKENGVEYKFNWEDFTKMQSTLDIKELEKIVMG